MKRERRELPVPSCGCGRGCGLRELLGAPSSATRGESLRQPAGMCRGGRVPAERVFSLNIGNESSLLALSKGRKWAAESRRNKNEDSGTDWAACARGFASRPLQSRRVPAVGRAKAASGSLPRLVGKIPAGPEPLLTPK